MPKYLTTEEVQRLFRKKSRKTIYRWIEEGKFPHARKMNKEYLIPQVDVKKLIKTLDNSGQ